MCYGRRHSASPRFPCTYLRLPRPACRRLPILATWPNESPRTSFLSPPPHSAAVHPLCTVSPSYKACKFPMPVRCHYRRVPSVIIQWHRLASSGPGSRPGVFAPTCARSDIFRPGRASRSRSGSVHRAPTQTRVTSGLAAGKPPTFVGRRDGPSGQAPTGR